MRELRGRGPVKTVDKQRSFGCFLLLAASLLAASGCCCPPQRPPRVDNGISVDVKVYDTVALRTQLATLGGQLSLISGIDQPTLIGRIGALQGAYSNQFSASLQATTMPTPTLESQTTTTAPSTQATTYTPTPGAVVPPAASLTAAQYNQVQATNTGQTQTNTLTSTPVTPAPAVLPTVQPAAMPTSFSTSSIDALIEEMQLSYQILNLQMVLQGALSDDYDENGNARRHITLGFPINVSARTKYPGKVAEVSVRVCSPARPETAKPPSADSRLDMLPSLQTIIPQENSYNVAGLVSNATSFGLGGIIAGVVNVGASVGSQHQTYYLMKEQDTIALPAFDGNDLSGYQCPLDQSAPNETQSVGFAWQFRPVLEHNSVNEGMRTTFAQISLPAVQPAQGAQPAQNAAPAQNAPNIPKTESQATSSLHVIVQTCWRDYDSKSGVVGDVVPDSCSVSGDLEKQDAMFSLADKRAMAEYIAKNPRDCVSHPSDTSHIAVWCYQRYMSVPLKYDTLLIGGGSVKDNHDGTLTVTVKGTFPQSTRVAIGPVYMNLATVGFENSGKDLRFTANIQPLALYGARLVSADSDSKEIQLVVPNK